MKRVFNNTGRKTHGMSRTRVFGIWTGIIKRCTNKNCEKYHCYGGKGIKLCRRWHKFEKFFEDMGHPPTPKHSIERVNANGDYKPSNCRWATQREQMNNMSRNRILKVGKEKLTLISAARRFGVNESKIRRRIGLGWPIEEALGIKPHKYKAPWQNRKI